MKYKNSKNISYNMNSYIISTSSKKLRHDFLRKMKMFNIISIEKKPYNL